MSFGPQPSFEYLEQIVNVQANSASIQHSQLQQSRHLISNQQSQVSHYHARQAAHLSRMLKKDKDKETTFEDELSLNPPHVNQSSNIVVDHLKLSSSSYSSSSLSTTTTTAPSSSTIHNSTLSVNSNTTTSTTTTANNSNTKNTWTMLDMGGMQIRTLSLQSSLFSTFDFLTCLYLNHNHLFTIPSSISALKNLMVLDLSFNKISILPAATGHLFQLRELWLFENLLETLPWEIGYLKNLSFLGIEGNPFCKLNPYYSASNSHQIIANSQHDLLLMVQYEHPIPEILFRAGFSFYICTHRNIIKGPQGVVSFLRDNMPFEHVSPFTIPSRSWIHSHHSSFLHNSDSFSLFSYNILSDKYASQQQYWYTPQWALSWNHRKELLLSEIADISADIICLQEVDWAQYEDFFCQRLCNGNEAGYIASEYNPSSHGSHTGKYRGLFQPKSRYRTMGKKNGGSAGVDGCAIFYASKFKPVAPPLVVEFNQLALGRSDFEKNDTLFERFCSRDNIALGLMLEDQQGRRVLVVNVHIHWDPLQTDVKFVQIVLLMEEIQKYMSKHGKVPLLLCGDFNSLPNGLVYNFLTSTIENPSSHPDLMECFEKSSSESNPTSVKVHAPSVERHGSQMNIEDNVRVKRWKSWQESGYGKIANATSLRHMFTGSLASAYKQIDNAPIENENVFVSKGSVYPMPALPFTNHTANFTGVIDYIFHTKDDFEVRGVLGGYYRDELAKDMVAWIEREGGDILSIDGRKNVWSVNGTQCVGFPNPVFASDHIPVVADFIWKTSKEKQEKNKRK